MVGDKELLTYMQENINMGLEALETLTKYLESTDNKIKSNVHKALLEYKEFYKKCKKALKGERISVSKESLIGSFMTKMGTKKEFMRDNSDSKIAETLIQGYNMGIMDISKKMNAYKGDISKNVLKLAEEYKKMMEKGIDSVKGFL